jgi:DnaD/phage-associated family protein
MREARAANKKKRATHVQRTDTARAGTGSSTRVQLPNQTKPNQPDRTKPAAARAHAREETPTNGKDEAAAAAANDYQIIVKTYEGNIGVITATMRDELKQAQADYPLEWITDAIQESAKYNARSWAYVDKVLKRWEREGRSDKDNYTKDESPKELEINPKAWLQN